ncbi:Na+/H+ antiporter subunit E [Geodermatophilus sp. DSM 45219]|uniref:Na+/H+ antiporter subunit E n=1 Tax=Geodermatophilus sp. DSM 45219 TaxID=1881103 RepID=UPI00088EF96E|nr:Na+/H+ antiporter subunit E [Geodermatophilus sp. DSM 45219]SDN53230.1 multisubunit sodium/proton antiporter, MrpE subunit [Geodermatophilus sp. DSM 45219]
MSVEPAATRLRYQGPLIAWLVLVWVLLWGTFSWANLLSGLVVALVLLALLPLPHVVGGARVRPLPLLVFLGHFLSDLVVSGAEVAWQTLRPGGVRSTAIVQVQLRVDSDLLLTMVAEATSLVPGSLVLDLDREQRVITLHLLPARDLADVERKKAHVLVVEGRLARAFGSADDIAAVERDEQVRAP